MGERCEEMTMLRTTRASAERSELIQRLDSFIEYATQTRKYQDLDLYEKVKAYIEAAPRDECEWDARDRIPDRSYAYDTGCGNTFYSTDGTPEDNGMLFCPYCAGRIKS